MTLSNGDILLLWPVTNHVLTAGWYYSDGSYHGALDFDVSVGSFVYAAEDGTVNWVQEWDGKTTSGNQSYGNLIRIEHEKYKGMKLETYYAHLSKIFVNNGDKVKAGELIAYSGNTGNTTGPHLHFEVRLAGSRVNPLNWLDNDFICKYDYVKLGEYTSVVVEGEKMVYQIITVKNISEGDYEALKEKLSAMDKEPSVLYTITTPPLTQNEADKIYLECVSRSLTNGNYTSKWEGD